MQVNCFESYTSSFQHLSHKFIPRTWNTSSLFQFVLPGFSFFYFFCVARYYASLGLDFWKKTNYFSRLPTACTHVARDAVRLPSITSPYLLGTRKMTRIASCDFQFSVVGPSIPRPWVLKGANYRCAHFSQQTSARLYPNRVK